MFWLSLESSPVAIIRFPIFFPNSNGFCSKYQTEKGGKIRPPLYQLTVMSCLYFHFVHNI